ncbi:hydrogenase maturation protease [Goodfellowiella coeruleoviolacea]|uniref:Hydrogenase maturation protease n=1 Tax=Goodfellowiella coeruleoviolacea TaxID=334858 RepID=A0AAE3G925_9PSEU|nr:hydrogenase maturation protease [Goodfellowiella coeruleoviolacea]MCP2163503.1 hydrogenase maturation protease [Goodfellowiella coeruleoviolacea]
MTSDASQPAVVVAGRRLRRGSRVRLRPGRRADILDLALRDQIAVVDAVEEDLDGRVHLVVTLAADPGRDLSARIGQRYFFGVDEVEPVDCPDEPAPIRVLVAGIGNVFLGDDGFGVEVVTQLRRLPQRAGVDVVDFGIRGMDLVYALTAGYQAAVLVDAAPRGERPGTVSLVEPTLDQEPGSVDAHGMDPVSVLRQARRHGPLPERVLLVACEPAHHPDPDDPTVLVELSEPVRAAVPSAVTLLSELLDELGVPPAESAGPTNRGDHG